MLIVFSAVAQAGAQRARQPVAAIDADLEEVTIAKLHEYYRTRRYSVAQVIRWHLDRIDRLNQTYAALIEIYAAEALQSAARLDAQPRTAARAPLWGVPVVVKANTSIAGKVMSNGWFGYVMSGKELRPKRDATVVHKLRAAGAIILGQTNMPDFAKSDTNRSSVGGRTGNSYDPRCSPGGSSGGTAVAVALNLAVLGQGTDTGNSIRNPAANASLVGVLPTRGLVSIAGIHPYDWLLDNTGPLARTVADAAVAMDVMAGADPSDARTAASIGRVPEGSFTGYLDADALRGKRFGVPHFILEGYPKSAPNPSYWHRGASPETRALFLRALEYLRAAGATVVIDPHLLPEEFGTLAAKVNSKRYRRQGVDAFLALYGSDSFRSAKRFEIVTGLRYPDDFIGSTAYQFILEADADADREYHQPKRRLMEEYRETLERFELDGLVYPALQVPANDETRPLPQDYPSDGPYSNTNWVNRLGVPAIVVPAGFYADGLPFGIEFAGDYWSDGALLGYAYAFEQATRARRPPPIRD